MTDSTMRKVSFRNCIIIMTSNVGAELITGKSALGFTENARNFNVEGLTNAIKSRFSPEFINRIDDIIVFNTLQEEDLIKISEKELENLRKRAENLGIEISYSSEVIYEIAHARDTEKYGARPIKRKITELIENELAVMIVNKSLNKGDKVRVEMSDKKISFSKCVAV